MNTTPHPHIVMLAAENDVIPGGKVGGIGDVVRDIPKALALNGARVTVLIPAYGRFHRLNGSENSGVFTTRFRGEVERIELYELYRNRDPGVRYLVMHHAQFASGGTGKIYCDDDAYQPFATDANKFALFSVASLSAITQGLLQQVDVLHCHDWHGALALALIEFDPAFQTLNSMRKVFSIHNLALQGIRPLDDNPSSLHAWYPDLQYNPITVADPRWPHCINPMATAIRLAHKVHTVSPTYADEIMQPNNPARGFHGGEGLEKDLQQAAAEQRLVGIINGIDYPPAEASSQARDWSSVISTMADEMLATMGRRSELRLVDYVAHQQLLRWQRHSRPQHVLTGVGRLTDQKMALLLKPLDTGLVPLESILDKMRDNGLFILLGSGDHELESLCSRIAANYPNFLFINQYSQVMADCLFENGDLFIMPSSFEPCGISQMLAMRAGQPCLAHAVGGLKDTIDDNINGFLFTGDSFDAQATAFIERLSEVLSLREDQPEKYRSIAESAREKRFSWQTSATRYLSELYS